VDDAAAEIMSRLGDPVWRVTSGALYKIMVKEADGDGSFVVPFVPNRAQRMLIDDMHHREIILKARQLGWTTLISILWLDHALFVPHQRCGIVAHDRESAEAIFRDKIRFAYDHLPEALQRIMPLAKDSASELLFAHTQSSIRVATSMRSGTIHRLLVSEFGKIAKRYPDKAQEVITGSLPAVPLTGVAIIESTAEGAEGPYYAMCKTARAVEELGGVRSARDWKFRFFAWHDHPDYVLNSDRVVISAADQSYFARVEAETGKRLKHEQKAWYIATRDADYPESPELMWQEYPSSADEAFQRSTEGTYYAQQLAVARSQGRITQVPTLPAPVNTFWDVGRSDQTAIWFHQQVGPEHRFVRYYEASGEDLTHYVAYLQSLGYIWGRHYLPHDADHKRLSTTNQSIREMLEDLGLRSSEIVDRIENVNFGIQQTRAAFAQCWFDEAGCKEGLNRLANYRKRWNSTVGAWANEPRHDDNSNGADAFRQFGQVLASGLLTRSGTVMPRRAQTRQSWRTA